MRSMATQGGVDWAVAVGGVPQFFFAFFQLHEGGCRGVAGGADLVEAVDLEALVEHFGEHQAQIVVVDLFFLVGERDKAFVKLVNLAFFNVEAEFGGAFGEPGAARVFAEHDVAAAAGRRTRGS